MLFFDVNKIFIIEHLEEKLWPWCLIEYKNISKLVGKDNVWFTNISDGTDKLRAFGKVFSESVKDMKLKDLCILDPDAPVLLDPQNSKKFTYFIFGGILGDEQFNWRTREELTKFMKTIPAFNLGKGQFSTDNAVYVTKHISEGSPLSNLQFQDNLEIEIKEGESVILPYRYPLVKGKPQISGELVKYLKNKDSF